MINILPCITTTYHSDWKDKLKNNRIKELAVFVTCLSNREEFYSLLKKSNIEKIPFVHLRGDMKIEELDYFVNQYQTKIFNIHSQKEFPILHDYSKYKDIIYIENTDKILDEQDLNIFAGVCLDFAHLENDKILHNERYLRNKEIINKNKIGCNHISGISKNCRIDEKNNKRYDNHYLKDLSELDYLKKYPLKYFSNFVAIELENDLTEHLKIKKYIENIINEKY